MSSDTLLAIFVGGKSSRMGGRPKGLLRAGNARPILEVLVSEGRTAGLEPALIGEASAYAGLASGVPRIADDPAAAGPLGGLRAALRHAEGVGCGTVVAVACDMPHVTASVLEQLARHPSNAPVLAPRRGPKAPWEPMLARYDVRRIRGVLDEAIERGVRSFQQLFSDIEVAPWPPTEEVVRALEDWDTPEDVAR